MGVYNILSYKKCPTCKKAINQEDESKYGQCKKCHNKKILKFIK